MCSGDGERRTGSGWGDGVLGCVMSSAVWATIVCAPRKSPGGAGARHRGRGQQAAGESEACQKLGLLRVVVGLRDRSGVEELLQV
mgnify:CR=1 FL=1